MRWVHPSSQCILLCLPLSQPLDFETRRSYTFRVEATNTLIDPAYLRRGPFKDVASVRVAVQDAPEPPVFTQATYHLIVPENKAPGTLVGRVSASDLDSPASPIRLAGLRAGGGQGYLKGPQRWLVPGCGIFTIFTANHIPQRRSHFLCQLAGGQAWVLGEGWRASVTTALLSTHFLGWYLLVAVQANGVSFDEWISVDQALHLLPSP